MRILRSKFFHISIGCCVAILGQGPEIRAELSMDFLTEERIVTAAKHAQKLSDAPANGKHARH